MGRAPGCEKVGLKRGPWTSEEDYILISFIQQHGHSNWRALPKQSGLLRCGKSCRLRWINYLRPDLKRGNFSKQEEDTIIQLHKVIENRWATIASKLPGRTDNEIKNVWHTHLKKRVNEAPKSLVAKHCDVDANNNTDNSSPVSNFTNNSSQQSEYSNDFSSFTDVSSEEIPNNTTNNVMEAQIYDSNPSELLDEVPIIDETYWSSPEISYDEFSMDFTFPDTIEDMKLLEASSSSSYTSMYRENGSVHVHQDDFWLNVLVKISGAEDLHEFCDFFQG